MYHVRRAADIAFEEPAAYAPHAEGHRRAAVVGRHVGSVHTGITFCTLESGGSVGEHLHSFEKSFYVLEGSPRLTLDGRTWQLEADDCGLVPLGVAHAWRSTGPCRWVEAGGPAPCCTRCSWSSTSPAAPHSCTTIRSRRATRSCPARWRRRPTANASRSS